MAAMFYTLKEAAARLGKTEKEVKRLAKEGKLREFRDGTTLLFKIDEVESLTSKAEVAAPEPKPETEPVLEAEDLLSLKEEPAPNEAVEPEDLESLFAIDEEQPAGEEAPDTKAPSEPLEGLDLGELQPGAPEEPAGVEEEALDLSDTQQVAAALTPEPDSGGLPEDEILLSQEGTGTSKEGELSALDTALTGEGVNVLGEADKEYKLTDDTLAETMAGLGATSDASLEEIEKDVNLDSFGSGSGLLDLSLQADDTSLGGILDEIYTKDEQKAGEGGVEAEEGLVADIASETEQMPHADEIAGAPLDYAAQAVIPIAAEPEPDTSSNMVGGLLILSLCVLTYTTIAAAGVKIFQTVPGIVLVMQGLIWYVVGGLVLVVIVIAAMAFMKGSGPRPPKAPKAPKVPKAPKPKKEKKEKKKKGAPKEG